MYLLLGGARLKISHNVNFDYDLGPLSALNLEYIRLDAKQTYLGVEDSQCEVRYT